MAGAVIAGIHDHVLAGESVAVAEGAAAIRIVCTTSLWAQGGMTLIFSGGTPFCITRVRMKRSSTTTSSAACRLKLSSPALPDVKRAEQ
jgi:hypothetical protein